MRSLSFDAQPSGTDSLYEAAIHTLLSPVLSNICELTHWDYGEVWMPSHNEKILELFPVFHITTGRTEAEIHALHQFHFCTQGLTFAPNVGLPGRVWSTQKPEWLHDATSLTEQFFLRHHIAKAFGVKTGFGIPIRATDRVLAVLVFFMLDVLEADELLIQQATTQVAAIADPLAALQQMPR